jgi:hypothetical protein
MIDYQAYTSQFNFKFMNLSFIKSKYCFGLIQVKMNHFF